ncbi:MAG: SGNH/GDSL hydrolase family protein [Planctomycetota bacterium]|nr:MAG: SGNH/GDSL hydrolase family protein [Planctomycetota bacterium]
MRRGLLRQWARWILGVGLGALALLAALEVGLRFVPGDHLPTEEYRLFRFDERLGWRLRPGLEATVSSPGEYRHRIRVNARGFRGAACDPRAPLRVALVGDSFLAGLGVRDDELVSSRLAAALGEGVSVGNYGVPGYGQLQELLLLEELLPRDRPDLVLLFLYVRNDLDDNVGTFDAARSVPRPRARLDAQGRLRWDEGPVTRPRPRLGQLAEVLGMLSCTARLLGTLGADRGDAAAARRSGPPAELRYCRKVLASPEEEALRVTVALARRFVARVRRVGARCGVVLVPTRWQVEDTAWRALRTAEGEAARGLVREEPQRRLFAELRAAGILCLDLLPALRARSGRLYYPWETHWTAAGHAAAAEELLRWLRAEGLVEPRDRAQRSALAGSGGAAE